MRQFCFHQKRQHRYNLFFNRYLPEENPQKTKKNEEMLRWVLVCIEKYSYLCKVLITKKEECGYSREF